MLSVTLSLYLAVTVINLTSATVCSTEKRVGRFRIELNDILLIHECTTYMLRFSLKACVAMDERIP